VTGCCGDDYVAMCIGEESRIASGEAVVDPDILAYDPPETLQRLLKCGPIVLRQRIGLAPKHQHANAKHALGLLGVTGKRPGIPVTIVCCR
jgi:hypothetical protein